MRPYHWTWVSTRSQTWASWVGAGTAAGSGWPIGVVVALMRALHFPEPRRRRAPSGAAPDVLRARRRGARRRSAGWRLSVLSVAEFSDAIAASTRSTKRRKATAGAPHRRASGSDLIRAAADHRRAAHPQVAALGVVALRSYQSWYWRTRVLMYSPAAVPPRRIGLRKYVWRSTLCQAARSCPASAPKNGTEPPFPLQPRGRGVGRLRLRECPGASSSCRGSTRRSSREASRATCASSPRAWSAHDVAVHVLTRGARARPARGGPGRACACIACPSPPTPRDLDAFVDLGRAA